MRPKKKLNSAAGHEYTSLTHTHTQAQRARPRAWSVEHKSTHTHTHSHTHTNMYTFDLRHLKQLQMGYVNSTAIQKKNSTSAACQAKPKAREREGETGAAVGELAVPRQSERAREQQGLSATETQQKTKKKEKKNLLKLQRSALLAALVSIAAQQLRSGFIFLFFCDGAAAASSSASETSHT